MANISSGAIKVVEVIGISSKSFDDAVAQAVKKASKSIKGITGVEVIKHSAKVEAGKLVQFKANCKLAFAVK
ncbi:MAG: dodecin domain-containing protein [Ignavibacteriae bacterium]|nr:dodecin domain-containing protein [Ignavibacteriota bacterium]MCB9208517.1 dodecin domain-containing protein [Ignavibacteriales bacterium]MCB9258374.1 dodecin domain-containing protein [Ignavibacteriales bacterium]